MPKYKARGWFTGLKAFSYNLPFSHNTSVTNNRQTDRRRQPWQKLDRYLSTPYGRLKTVQDRTEPCYCSPIWNSDVEHGDNNQFNRLALMLLDAFSAEKQRQYCCGQ